MTKPKTRKLDGRNRDGHHVLALLSDHLPLLDVLPEVLLDLAPYDSLEAGVVRLDLLAHR